MIRVILNLLPPARIDTPSAALSTLKSFLKHQAIDATIIYWNILLDRLLPSFERNTDETHLELLPYLYLIADEHRDEIKKSEANAVMKAQLPVYDILNNRSNFFARTKNLLDAAFSRELSPLLSAGPVLLGISCKYEQWIPGIVLANYVKKQFPHVKIVIGGLRNRDKAEAVMKMCSDFDYAIWGEGEYPLLALCRVLDGQTEDVASVPRLLFRSNGSLLPSDTDTSDFFDMNSGIFPDYDDYFRCLEATHGKSFPVILPLESSRGCTWNACKFCVYAEGYHCRKKDPAVLETEILHLLKKHKTPYFAFMDNDIVANDHARLDKILDKLILIKKDFNIHFIAEVIPKHFTATTMKKLSQAGLNRIHFGYEALSDRLLKKLGKKTSFSDNLLFVKLTHKCRITLPSANIICGAVGEDNHDILESIDNLHFLRFYFDKNFFVHNIIPLRVAHHSDFYDMIPKESLLKWSNNPLFHLLPDALLENIDRFSLFDFSAEQNFLWNMFAKINTFYYEHNYRYNISREGDAIVYSEYFDGELAARFGIGALEYQILQKTNLSTMDWSELSDILRQGADARVDEESVRISLDRLKEKHLIYFNDSYNAIISVIDADQVF